MCLKQDEATCDHLLANQVLYVVNRAFLPATSVMIGRTSDLVSSFGGAPDLQAGGRGSSSAFATYFSFVYLLVPKVITLGVVDIRLSDVSTVSARVVSA